MSDHDLSDRDSKYFVSGDTYNCPYCNRRNIKYSIKESGSFDWNRDRTAHFYVVSCSDCNYNSFHLSWYNLARSPNRQKEFMTTPTHQSYQENPNAPIGHGRVEKKEKIQLEGYEKVELDDVFFYHQPTSFFTLNSLIPSAVREPLNEAQNCLKNNFLTGASAGLRKAIYKLLKHEKIAFQNEDGNYITYNQRIKLLSQKFPNIDQGYFHDLEDIQGLTSQELHENDWEDLKPGTLRFLLEVTQQLLNDMYVVPKERQKRRQKIIDLKKIAKPIKINGKDKEK